ncbi:cystathionine gamma-synthase [Microlunatus sp. Y2014]|uniref:cystathionine gamma-synthase n=1 Tax=Microlunatus sp. Y2014 TaxID=3418488 RepID=UPI003DA77EFE
MTDPTDTTGPTGSRLGRALRTGIDCDPAHGAVAPPVYLSSTFTFAGYGESRQYDYTRSGNPTRDLLAQAVATLEGGADGVITSSGLSALTLIVTSLLRTGDTLVIPHDCYGGSWRLFRHLAAQGHFLVEPVDLTDTASAVRRIGELDPAMVLLETPSNPLLRLTDLAAVSEAAHRTDAIVVADNTFCSPILQRPLELGADLVLHSTTKYLNGHSDMVGGVVIAADAEMAAETKRWANVLGLTASPFDSYLALRGLRTIDARMRVHQENAEAVVEALVGHPAVAAVHYPGLPDHPGHDIAARQQDGFGAMVSFDLHGSESAAKAFVEGLTFFSLAESLGGIESLVAHPATMTHAAMSAEALAVAGVGGGLLRLSVGIEPAVDLVADIQAGLARAS